jgi:hypothetical protein
MRRVVRQGAVAPEFFSIFAEAGESGIDLSTATSATIEVQLPDGTKLTWSGTLEDAAVVSVTVKHTFAANDADLPVRGKYIVYAHVVTASSAFRTEPERLDVLGKFDVEDLFHDPL